MAKIRSLGNKECKQVLSLLERFSGDEFSYPVLERYQTLYMPFHFISQFLPLRLKFLPSIYVATAEGKVLGLIWLSRDGHRQDRWKIEQVIIDPDYYSAYDVGKQLIYYVINKFGAMGVETFLAYADPHYTEGLALLKECGFRHCTKMHTYQLERPNNNTPEKGRFIQGIREAKSSDARELQELHSETLLPELRVSLRRSPEDFVPGFAERLKRNLQGEFSKRWVVSQGSHDYLYGSVSISTWDYKHYDLSLLISPAWEDGTEDLVLFGIEQIYKSCQHAKITVQAYDFQKQKLEILEQQGFQKTATTEILVKDYWIPLKDKPLHSRNPVLLFAKGGKTSPA